MSRGKKIIRGSATRAASFILSIVVSFFLMPFLIHELGDQMYGIWTLVGTFIGYFGLMDIGLSSAVGRFISRAIGRNDAEEMKKVISTSFYLFLALGLVAALVVVVVSAILPSMINIPEHTALFRFLLILLAVSTIFDFPIRVFNSVLTSNLREDISSGITIVKTVFCTIFIVWTVKIGYGVLGLALTSVLFSILDSLVRVYISYRIDARTTIRFSYFDLKKLRPLFHYSFFALLGRIANLMRLGVNQFIIGGFVGLSAVTHFFVASRLIEYLVTLIVQMIGVIAPMFSQDEGNNDFPGIRRNFLLSSKISLFSSVFFCGLTFLYGPYFITRWMGPGYTDSIHILLILAIPTMLQLIQAPVIPVLEGISKLKHYVFPNLIEGVLILVLSLWWVNKWGVYGVALATAVPMTLKHLFVQPPLVCRALNLNLKSYLSDMARGCGLGTACVIGGWLLVRWEMEPDYLRMVLGCLFQALIYWPIVIYFGFTIEERQRVLPVIKESLPFYRRFSQAPQL